MPYFGINNFSKVNFMTTFIFKNRKIYTFSKAIKLLRDFVLHELILLKILADLCYM